MYYFNLPIWKSSKKKKKILLDHTLDNTENNKSQPSESLS